MPNKDTLQGFSCRDHVTINSDTDSLLREAHAAHPDAIVTTEQLFQLWSNGAVSKHIYFEHTNGIATTAKAPTVEASPFSKLRWNVCNGYMLMTKSIYDTIPASLHNDPIGLCTYLQNQNIPLIVIPNTVAYEKPPLCFSDFFRPSQLVKKIEWLRHHAVWAQGIFVNTKTFFTEGAKRRHYQETIARFHAEKKMIIGLDGGLGDCLIYSTLPRLLSEKYGITVYLTEHSKTVIRNPEIRSVCFDDNPFFGGYVESDTGFRFHGFIRESNLIENLTGACSLSALENLEAQFGVSGSGLPEIFYKPTIMPELQKTLLIDANWHSGKKWGLYNDPSILEAIITQWRAKGSDYKVQYVETTAQNIYVYLDMLASAGQFVSYFSGGNALAAALNIPAIIIVPENLDGTALTMFMYHHAPITYVRRRSLARYGVYSKINELIK